MSTEWFQAEDGVQGHFLVNDFLARTVQLPQATLEGADKMAMAIVPGLKVVKFLNKRTSMTTSEATQRLTGDLKAVAHDAQHLVRVTAGQAGEKVNQLGTRLMESTKETAERLQKEAVAAAKATDRCVREHPYQTIGVAFGLGLLIGVLAARKR